MELLFDDSFKVEVVRAQLHQEFPQSLVNIRM